MQCHSAFDIIALNQADTLHQCVSTHSQKNWLPAINTDLKLTAPTQVFYL